MKDVDDSTPVLDMADVSYAIVGDAADNEVLKALNLQVSHGELHVLLGPNGSGKTTLLGCASGLLQPQAGDVRMNGQSLRSTPYDTLARRRAALNQQSSLAFPLAVREVVRLGRMPHSTGADHDEAIVRSAMGMLYLDDLASRPVTRLSGGEFQRAQLARVFAQVMANPQAEPVERGLLLLDEPVSALDITYQKLCMEILKEFCGRGLSALVVLHDINLASRYADQLSLLREGRIIASGSPREALTPATLRAAYSVDAFVFPHPVDGNPVWVT